MMHLGGSAKSEEVLVGQQTVLIENELQTHLREATGGGAAFKSRH